MSVDAMSVALTSLLGLPPAIVTGEDLADQLPKDHRKTTGRGQWDGIQMRILVRIVLVTLR
eukprot:2470151-Pyramimonas_sp.AAC.1